MEVVALVQDQWQEIATLSTVKVSIVSWLKMNFWIKHPQYIVTLDSIHDFDQNII